MHSHVLKILSLSYLLLSSALQAESWSGELGLQLRAFSQNASATPSHDLSASAQFKLENQFQLLSLGSDLRIELQGQFDQHDSERSYVDIKELHIQRYADNWEFKAGISTVFWGVAESQHLVDIVNQSNWAVDFDGEDKLGQAMLNLRLFRDWGELDFYLLPGFNERLFPGEDGRPGFRATFEKQRYESSAKRNHTDIALRYSKTIGAIDVGVSYFKGTTREPRLLLNAGRIDALYEQIDQVGLDVQATLGAWLWKFESIYRKGQGADFTAAIAGFEATAYSLADSDFDLGFIVELAFDSRKQNIAEAVIAHQPLAIRLFEKSAFYGLRLGFNDLDSSSLLVGCSSEIGNSAFLCVAEGSRRIGENVVLNVNAKVFDGLAVDNVFASVQRDDLIEFSVSWHF